MAKDLVYTVGVDAGDAVSGLRKLEGAVRSTMREVGDELDDSASAGDKFAASIDRLSSQMREDFNSAAIAAEELKRALREAGSSLEVGDAISELRRMGLSFDEITADADKLATSLKQLDDARLAGVKDLDSVAPGLASKLDDVNKSADSSRSALANMVGNSAQDLGQLAGVTGSLGVGIGQLAEYAADARFAGEGLGSTLKSMSLVAGPMAALALATQLVGTAMAGIKAEKAFRAGLVDDFADDMRDAQTVAESLLDTLKETGNLDVTVPFSSGFLNLGAEAKSLVEIVDKLGLSWDEVLSDIKDPGARARIEETTADMVFQGDEAERLAVLWNDYALGVDQYGDAWRDASGQQEIANRLIAEAEESGVGQAEALEEARKETERLAEEQAQAVQEARDYEVQMSETTRALLELSSASAEAGRRRDAITNVLGGESLWLDGASALRDIREGIEGLSEAADGIDLSEALDPTKMGADKLLDAFDGLRPQIQEKLAEAFEVGGGEKVKEVAADYVAQIVEELGGKLTAEEVENILGISDLDAVIAVSLNVSALERVRSELDVLTGLNGETPFTAAIKLALEAGTITPEAAEVLVRSQLGTLSVPLPTDVTPPTPEELAEAGAFATDYYAQNAPTVPLAAEPQGLVSGAAEAVAEIEDKPATIPLEGDDKDANKKVDAVKKKAEDSKPVVTMSGETKQALAEILYLRLFAALLGPVVRVTADASSAVATLNAVQRLDPKVGVDAYLADYPTASEIVAKIGRPRVPVDIVVGQSIRITGIRE